MQILHDWCVDISWLLNNASDMRIKDIGSPCALAKWLTLYIKFVVVINKFC